MKKIISLLLCLTFSLTIVSPVFADTFDVGAQEAIAIDATTGKILYEKTVM